MKFSSNLLKRTGLTLLVLGAVVTSLAFTFTLNRNTGLPIKWPAGALPIRILLGSSPVLNDGTNYSTSAQAAANIWNSELGAVQFQSTIATGTPSENNDVNELGFAAKIFGRDFGESTLAVTTGFSQGNERTEADIIFNSAYTWDSYRGARPSSLPSGTIDLQRVAIHELGHVLGLDHPDEAGQQVSAIMNSRINDISTLTADDKQGGQALYGPPGGPANDAFANATAIINSGSKSITVKGYNTNATKESNDPRQGDNPGGRSVWWFWTAPGSGNVTLDTGRIDPTTKKIDLSGGKSSFYDTTLGVYTGSTLDALTKLGDNDDIDPGVVQVSNLTFSATAGTTYRFCVDGYNAIEQISTDNNGADNGGISLNLTFDGDLGTAPAITTQPAGATVNSGGSASFSVTATGSAPLAYQWLFNTNAISGATNSTLSLSSVTSSQAGTYTVTVSNAAGSTTSNGATLTVNTPPPAPPPSSGGGGGGGGGAPSFWFCAALAILGLGRRLRFRSCA